MVVVGIAGGAVYRRAWPIAQHGTTANTWQGNCSHPADANGALQESNPHADNSCRCSKQTLAS